MGGIYGRSRAGKLIQEGRYEEAVAEATRAFEHDPTDAGALVDRASALGALGRHAEAAADLEAALRTDEPVGQLDVDAIDDAYFSALLAAARADVTGAERLDHYRDVFPRGTHLDDTGEWQRRLRGEIVPRPIVKERE